MARFGPTVLPQPVDIGGIFDRIAQGYQYGRGLREDRRRREREERLDRERQEDRNRYLAALRARDLSEPGASTVAGFLDERLQTAAQKPVALSERAQPRFRGRPMATLRESPQAQARFREEALADTPLTTDYVSRAAQAAETGVPLEFREPEPQQVRLPSGRTITIRDRAPYLMESGVVMDPRRAREERTLAAALEEQERRYARIPTSEEHQVEIEQAEALAGARLRGGRLTPEQREEDLRQAEELARRTGLLAQRERPSTIPRAPVSLGALERQIDDTRELLSLLERTNYPLDDKDDPIQRQAYQAGLDRIEDTRQRLVELMLERDAMVRDLRGAGAPPARAAPEPASDLRDAFRYTPGGRALAEPPAARAPAAAVPATVPRSAREKADSARAAGNKIPIAQEEYDDMVQAHGEEYARQYFVVR